MKIKSTNSPKSSKFLSAYSKNTTVDVPTDLLTDLQQTMQDSKIPSIFVSQLSQLINIKGKSNTSMRNSGKNDLKSSIPIMSFLGFQKNLNNYVQNSGLNRFSRDFDVKIKEMYGLIKRSMPNVARELLDLNVYEKSRNSFISNFDKVRKHFDNNLNYNSTNSKKNSNSNHKKCQEIFEQISKQISSNDIILEFLKSINNYINNNNNSNLNNDTANNKTEYCSSSFQDNEYTNDSENFSSPSLDDIIDSKNNNYNQNLLLTLTKYTSTNSNSIKDKENQEQLIQNEIQFLQEQRSALQTALEMQQNLNELKTEVSFLYQTLEEEELIKGLIEIEEEFLIESSKEVERAQTINESIHAMMNGDFTISTVDFDNMKLKSELSKIENRISNIEQKKNFISRKSIQNLPLLKKSKKLLKIQLNNLTTDPLPPQLQKLKNDKLMKQILHLQEENDRISISRSDFDEYEVLNNYAKKCQNDYYQLKDVYEETLLSMQKSSTTNEEIIENNNENTDDSSFNDEIYIKHLVDSHHHKGHHHNEDEEETIKRKPKNIDANQLKKLDILRLLRELQDEYSICMSNIERITNRKSQEKLQKKRKFIKRQRTFLNDLLTTAYECSEELKESFEIEAELFEEASQRGIDIDCKLSDIVFDCMKKSEMINTIEERCNDIGEMIEYSVNENRSKKKEPISIVFNNCNELEAGVRKIIEKKGEERSAQLMRIFNLKNELASIKNQK